MDISNVFIFQEPFIYFIILGLAVGFGVFLFRRMKSDKTEPIFKGQTLKDVLIKENMFPIMESFGMNIKKGKLITKFKAIKIKKIAKVKFETTLNNEKKSHELLIFDITKGLLSSIPIINSIFKSREYLVINDNTNYIVKDRNNDVYTISNDVFLYKFGGIWICSKESQQLLTELQYKKMLEDEKEEGINYIKRIVFYNDIYAQNVGKLEQAFKLEQEKWNKTVEDLTGDNNRTKR